MGNSMNLINDVTLICVDTVDLYRGIVVIENCRAQVSFRHVVLISSISGDCEYLHLIPPELLKADDPLLKYSEFCIRELYKHFTTRYCLIVQHDGYIVNPAAWRDEWLQYDYIGCQTCWTEPGDNGKGGNGGFSLRSRKLMRLASHKVRKAHPEDWRLSRAAPFGIREELEMQNCKFAPASVQKLFGLERMEYSGQFGHHQGINL